MTWAIPKKISASVFGCHIDATEQQRALNFESLVAFLCSFCRLQVIQNQEPWFSVVAYVTAGLGSNIFHLILSRANKKKMWESFIICLLTSIANFYERYPFIWSRFKITMTKSNANVLSLEPDGQSFSQWKSVGLCQKLDYISSSLNQSSKGVSSLTLTPGFMVVDLKMFVLCHKQNIFCTQIKAQKGCSLLLWLLVSYFYWRETYGT